MPALITIALILILIAVLGGLLISKAMLLILAVVGALAVIAMLAGR